ncbi:hypothetical protein DB345_17725 [Spartobacteria bacterium LR76]|nr:hypothetical protein DB345_17725 [Spartobacteria bacterium LR76]
MKIAPLLLAATLTAQAALAETLLEERFENYGNEEEIVASEHGKWVSDQSDGGCIAPVLVTKDSQCIQLSATPSGQIRNGFLWKSFPAVSQSKVRLTFRMLHNEGGAGQYVGLFNAARTAGYAIWWTAGDAPTTGVVKVLRFEGSNPIPWSDRGTEIAVVRAGSMTHDSQNLPLAAFDFFLDQKTGEFRLAIDGQDKAEGRDGSPIQALSTVVLKGNKGAFFDDIVVATEN